MLGGIANDYVDRKLNKPEIDLIAQRLMEVETSAVMKGEMRDEVRKLREGLNDRITTDEFRAMVGRTTDQIGTIKARLDALEQRVEILEVKDEDRDKGTKNAEQAWFFVNRGGVFHDGGNRDRALANYNIGLALDPTYAPGYLGRARAYTELGVPDLVILDASEAIRLGSKDGNLFLYRGAAYDAKGKYDLAIQDFTVTADGAPTLANPLHFRALSYLNKGDAIQAIIDCQRALQLEPGHAGNPLHPGQGVHPEGGLRPRLPGVGLHPRLRGRRAARWAAHRDRPLHPGSGVR